MLYEYLCSNYKPNEPIFVADVSLPVSNVNLRQMFKNTVRFWKDQAI